MKKILIAICLLVPSLVLADNCQSRLMPAFTSEQAKTLCTKLPDYVADSYVPQTTNTINLGSSSLTWASAFIGTGVNFAAANSALIYPAANSETVAAAGTVQGDAAALSQVSFHKVTGADATKGVMLPVTTTLAVGTTHIILSTTAAVLKIYPQSGGAINGGAANASISTVSGLSSTLCRVTGTNAWDCA